MIAFVEISGFAARDAFAKCQPWFLEAIERCPHSFEDIHSLYRAVITNGASLLLISVDEALVAGAILRKSTTPTCDVLEVVAVGGSRMKEWFELFHERLIEIAKAKQCKYLIEGGRAGWTKFLEKYGWEEAPRLMMRMI